MTELFRCERTADAWLTEVQTELRHGQLSDNNHAFLHGQPTTVPGSWIAGRASCKSQQCAALGTGDVPPHRIQQPSPRETCLDGGKAAMAAAARQGMWGVVWLVAALRRHAGSRHRTLRQKARHPKRMPRDDRGLVVLCG